jgi:hypothetical protein
MKSSARELRFWYPLRDFLSYLELRKRGELDFGGWFKSIATTAHVFPLASLADPGPMAGAALALFHRLIG